MKKNVTQGLIFFGLKITLIAAMFGTLISCELFNSSNQQVKKNPVEYLIETLGPLSDAELIEEDVEIIDEEMMVEEESFLTEAEIEELGLSELERDLWNEFAQDSFVFEIGTEEPAPKESCSPDFLANRRGKTEARALYTKMSQLFKTPISQLSCDKDKKIAVDDTRSVPVFWTVIGNEWKKSDAVDKMNAAKAWFQKYCVDIDSRELSLSRKEFNAYSAGLKRANAQGKLTYTSTVDYAYTRLWKKKMKKARGVKKGKTARFFLILFVDTFAEVNYGRQGGRVNNVAGNFAGLPLILIPSNENRRQIVSHELIHAFGKNQAGFGTFDTGKRKISRPITSTHSVSIKNCWNEGSCARDMGNAVALNESDLMDIASYYEMLVNRNIFRKK